MIVLVTRPEREALEWVQALCAAGHSAEALPLIRIELLPTGPAWQQAWAAVPQAAAVMFVSANAVQGFFQAGPGGRNGREFPVSAWATGPGTMQALQKAGVPPERIVWPGAQAEQFDSEALWALVEVNVHAGDRVLIVRGADTPSEAESGAPATLVGAGRDWLAQQIQAQGGVVDWLATYRRAPPVWTAAQQARAQHAAVDGTAWLLSSSESVRHLQAVLPGQHWAQACAVATHARIAEAARAAGFGRVLITRPALPDVLAALVSIESRQ
jgi:uroporphyrinogen-III synthase